MASWSGAVSSNARVTSDEAAQPEPGPLTTLSGRLLDRGLAASIIWFGSQKRIKVLNRSVRQLSETIYLAPAADGSCCYFWSWGDVIAPVTDIPSAVSRIATVLMPDA